MQKVLEVISGMKRICKSAKQITWRMGIIFP